MTHLPNPSKPKVNAIYPTDDSVEMAINRFKSALPITDENQLFTLLMIYNNTVITNLQGTKP